MGINACQKGKAGEREFCELLNNRFGTKLARTPNSGGLAIRGDIIRKYNSKKSIIDKIHWEIKRVEKLNVHEALNQACRDTGNHMTPVVAFRKNEPRQKKEFTDCDGKWLVCLKAEDFLQLLQLLEEKESEKIQ